MLVTAFNGLLEYIDGICDTRSRGHDIRWFLSEFLSGSSFITPASCRIQAAGGYPAAGASHLPLQRICSGRHITTVRREALLLPLSSTQAGRAESRLHLHLLLMPLPTQVFLPKTRQKAHAPDLLISPTPCSGALSATVQGAGLRSMFGQSTFLCCWPPSAWDIFTAPTTPVLLLGPDWRRFLDVLSMCWSLKPAATPA